MTIQVHTTCPRDCYDSCGLIVTLDDRGRIASVRGDPSHPMTRGFACPRGTADHGRLTARRVRWPAVRDVEALRPAPWEHCLDLVAQRLQATLQERGPEAVLYLTYAGNTGLLTLDVPQRLWNAIGATQTDFALCSKSGHAGIALHYGHRYGITPEELPQQELIVFWGFNAAVSSPHLWALAREARRENGAAIAVIDPRRSRSADQADLWVQPQPGTDVALAYGLIHQLVQAGSADLAFLERWTIGFDALRAAAAEWPPERVEQVSGVPRQQLHNLAEAYGGRRPSATMIGFGLQKSDHGADQARAASFLAALLGQHRGFFYSNGDSLGINRALLSGAALTERPPRIVPQVALADMLQAGEFRFVYVSGMNPAVTQPNLQALRAGLSRDDVFLVVHETHWTETTEYADVVLAAPTYLEKDDLVPPWSHNVMQLSPQIVPPITDSRTEWQVMQELARRLGLAEDWLYQDPWQVVEESLQGAFESGSWQNLRAGARVPLRRLPKDQYQTPSGKMEFDSSLARQQGFDPLPVQQSLSRPPGTFVLLNTATEPYTSSQFREVYGPIPAYVTIHPADARALRIAEGDTVALANDLGQVRAEARISDAVPPGVLWTPRQWHGLDGQPQNVLMSSEPQALGHGPRFNSTTVTLSRDR